MDRIRCIDIRRCSLSQVLRACDTRRMSDGLVRILTTPDVFEGLIARSRLEDEGIPVMTSGDESRYRVGAVHVFVPVEYEALTVYDLKGYFVDMDRMGISGRVVKLPNLGRTYHRVFCNGVFPGLFDRKAIHINRAEQSRNRPFDLRLIVIHTNSGLFQ